MPFFSENQIRSLHAEFKSLKKYADKLALFDRLFGIIPMPFPDFDPQLRFFFQRENTEELEILFRKERNNPSLAEKRFVFVETFVFNIKPANSNSALYSGFILTRFLSRRPVFEDLIRRQKTDGKPVELLLDEANGLINSIEYSLQNEYDKSFRLQCMSVFYKGFFEAFTNRVNLPGKKRKFIELYLYAQGIIYANYIGSLKTALILSLSPVGSQNRPQLDLPGKIELMADLEIIDVIKKKYAGMDPVSLENKLAEVICLITGEYLEQKELILRLIRKGQSGITNSKRWQSPTSETAFRWK
jgi:hypothetical protein